MTFKKLYLPVGLIMAIIAALLFPQSGIWLKEAGAVLFFVVVIFLVGGWHLDLNEIRINKHILSVFSVVLVGSLLIGPFIGYGVAHLLNLSPDFTTGLIVMSAVPVTLSSATVITGVCGGNTALALFMTLGLNMAGIFTAPFFLKLCLESSGGIELSASQLLVKLLLLVLLPCVVGFVVKKLTRLGTHPVLQYTPSTCVILTVFAACAASRELLVNIPFATLPVLILSTLTVHLLLMGIMFLSGTLLKTDAPEKKAMLFVGSQKTLPLAISVLSMLPVDSGLPVILCLIFHFGQLLSDSVIAAHLARKQESATALSEEPAT